MRVLRFLVFFFSYNNISHILGDSNDVEMMGTYPHVEELKNKRRAKKDAAPVSFVPPPPAPSPKPTPNPTEKPTNNDVSDCGCPQTCTDEVLDRMADTFTCRARIEWCMGALGQTETEACQRVSNEFPDVCGQGCSPRL